jgi:dinuclear metal center YbgI/SA1388 family protein
MTESGERTRPIDLKILVDYLDGLLQASTGKDPGINGLQVEGRSTVRKLATGVSACQELFEKADAVKADAVLVHHGIFWRGQDPTLIGTQYRRVKVLIGSAMSLLAYHLPLDRHPQLGNNILGLRGLDLVDPVPFAEFEGQLTGFWGSFDSPVPVGDFVARCRELFEQEPLVFAFGPKSITRAGIVSGGGASAIHEAITLGLDAFVTGEPTEWVMNLARESGVNFVAAGHYATERLGVRALGEHLEERFGLEVEFIDVPNPV